jgi:hypothetical protein
MTIPADVLPIKLAEQLTLWACIREVLGPNVGQDTGYPDIFFVVFSVPPGKFRASTSIKLSSPYPSIRRYVV